MPAANPFLRSGSGPSAYVEMPTLEIPARCHELCVWVVVRPARGTRGSVSRLKHRSAACGARLHREAARD